MGDGVATIGPLSEAKIAAGGRGLRRVVQPLGRQDRAEHLELRQVEVEIAAEYARL